MKTATDLLTAVLQVFHQRLLHPIKLRKLHVDSFPSPLQVLRTLGKIPPALDTSRCDRKGSLTVKNYSDMLTGE
jgi:hypothetical protein